MKISTTSLALIIVGLSMSSSSAFTPSSFLQATKKASSTTANVYRYGQLQQLNMIDTSQFVNDATNAISTLDLASGTSNLLSFSDQGQNLAGIFFQASLLPYLIFLYFLSFRGNRVPDLGNFGFQFLLLFVFATIPSGIISKGTYGCTLADVDWLHGGAEALLTITNVLIVLGFRNAMSMSKEEQPSTIQPKLLAFGGAAAFAAACAVGPSLGVGAHSPFLLGLGGLPTGAVESLPWVRIHKHNLILLSILCYVSYIIIRCFYKLGCPYRSY